jgi:hypothetical protein
MSFVAATCDVYNADDLAKFIDLPESFRGKKVRIVPDNAVMSKGGVAYYPFTSEEETNEWLDEVVSEWWNDETI